MERVAVIGAVAVGAYLVLGGDLGSILGAPQKILSDISGVVGNITGATESLFHDFQHPFDSVGKLF